MRQRIPFGGLDTVYWFAILIIVRRGFYRNPESRDSYLGLSFFISPCML